MFAFKSFSNWEVVANESPKAAAEVKVGVDIAKSCQVSSTRCFFLA